MIAELTSLIHTQWDGKSPLKLYISNHSGFHFGGQWFEDIPQYPEEEITTVDAMQQAATAIAERREVRICDGGDRLVFHSAKGLVVYDGGIARKEKQ